MNKYEGKNIFELGVKLAGIYCKIGVIKCQQAILKLKIFKSNLILAYIKWKMERVMIPEFKGEYRYLSNFWPAEITVDDIKYPSSEHAYQASKTKLVLYKEKIAKQMTAGQAKRFSYKLPLPPEWEHIKIGIMKELLVKKFAIPELRKKLINTGTKKLIEGNTWHDNFWGSCTCPKCGNKGMNVLGKLLMEVRSECGGKI